MRKSSCTFVMPILLLAGMVVAGSGCGKKKVATVPPYPPSPPSAPSKPSSPAPTISLEASPSTITSGQASTLKWNTTDATSVTIDGGVGTVEATGSREVTPAASVTFTAKATGPRGKRQYQRPSDGHGGRCDAAGA